MGKVPDKSDVSIVFWLSIAVVLVIVVLALVLGNTFTEVTSDACSWLMGNFGWFFMIIVFMCIVVSVIVIFRPIGKIRLGNPKSKPEFSTISWIAMLFSAGMGIGLIFYGAAEPISHFAASSPFAEEYSVEAMEDALKLSFFHWGISAWAVYALVAMSIAYFHFRKKERMKISSTLKPIFGTKMDGISGNIVDTVTIVAAVTGVATTLGLGAAQINGGLNYVFGVPKELWVQYVIIIVATVLYMISAYTGIKRGVKHLSNLNILLAFILMVCAFIVGPTTQILDGFTETLGVYMRDFMDMSFMTGAFGSETEKKWIQSWTLYYWTWWIAWSPFVGIFIARISRGRTIREFLAYVLLIPSLFSFIWMSVFGIMGMDVTVAGNGIASLPAEEMLFSVFDQYPLSLPLSIIAIVLVFSFFITSADSATLVLGMQSQNGTLHPKKWVKLMWGIMLALIAAVLLTAGGLVAVQNVMIILAFPFCIVFVLMIISVIRELRYEGHEMGLEIRPKRYPEPDSPFRSYEEDDVDEEDDEIGNF